MVCAMLRSSASVALRGGRCPVGAPTVAVGPAGRLRCDARATRAAACPGACKRQGVRQAWDSPQGTVPRPGSLPPSAALDAPRTSRRPRRSGACGPGLPLTPLALQAAPGRSARPLARHGQSTGLSVSGLAFSPPHKSPTPATALRAASLVVCDDAYHGGAGKAAVGCAPAATLRGAEERRAARVARRPEATRRPHTVRAPSAAALRSSVAPARGRVCVVALAARAPQGSRPAGPTAVHERRRIPGRGFASLKQSQVATQAAQAGAARPTP